MIRDPHQKVLDALRSHNDPDYCYVDFDCLAKETGLDRKQVRRSCRLLKRKGLAKFYAGLWDDDGNPRGSGYAATALALGLEPCPTDGIAPGSSPAKMASRQNT